MEFEPRGLGIGEEPGAVVQLEARVARTALRDGFPHLEIGMSGIGALSRTRTIPGAKRANRPAE